ncbi:MAG: hypothetical protein HYY86_00275 [Candidatus Harrisonbacteria bacterium]|nr:hypothetical protein [Candidatus Harrisonbacteria bacterium]
MSTQRGKIVSAVLQILKDKPEGIRYSELFRAVKNTLPEANDNTVHSTIWDLDKKVAEITKPERGIFILRQYIKEGAEIKLREEKISKGISESAFYASFADYLVKDLGECTKAVPLGGNRFGDRWGTPDVFGVYKFSETDRIRPQPEIVSAEIKTDTSQIITAFGQACAYKLFSHKVYLVIPEDAERDIERVESLCMRFGIGLILFDKNNAENPNWAIRARANKSEPDFFYVNKYLEQLGDDLKNLF